MSCFGSCRTSWPDDNHFRVEVAATVNVWFSLAGANDVAGPFACLNRRFEPLGTRRTAAAMGRCRQVLVLGSFLWIAALALDNGVGRLPPMGWSTWNAFGEAIDEEKIKAQADIMVSSGMRDAGYRQVRLRSPTFHLSQEGAAWLVIARTSDAPAARLEKARFSFLHVAAVVAAAVAPLATMLVWNGFPRPPNIRPPHNLTSVFASRPILLPAM